MGSFRRYIFSAVRVGFVSLILNWASLANASTVVTDTNGAASVNATAADGSAVALKEGDEVAVGTQIIVPQNQSVTVATDTGMEVVADQGAKIRMGKDDDEVPLIDVIAGEVRSFLSPSEPKPANPTPRLRISTPGAVVGVRGTDFVVDAGAEGNTGGPSVHTLEGTVEVAPSGDELRSGHVTSLGQGESVENVHAGSPLVKKTFNRDEFMRNFSARHPRFAAMQARASARRAQFRQALQRRVQTFKKNIQNRREEFQKKKQERQEAAKKYFENRRKQRQQKKKTER